MPSNHDLIVFLLGSLSGFSFTFFVFACWYSRQTEALNHSIESRLADARRICWADGYRAGSENGCNSKITTKL